MKSSPASAGLFCGLKHSMVVTYSWAGVRVFTNADGCMCIYGRERGLSCEALARIRVLLKRSAKLFF
jgi:hypothetical protein